MLQTIKKMFGFGKKKKKFSKERLVKVRGIPRTVFFDEVTDEWGYYDAMNEWVIYTMMEENSPPVYPTDYPAPEKTPELDISVESKTTNEFKLQVAEKPPYDKEFENYLDSLGPKPDTAEKGTVGLYEEPTHKWNVDSSTGIATPVVESISSPEPTNHSHTSHDSGGGGDCGGGGCSLD